MKDESTPFAGNESSHPKRLTPADSVHRNGPSHFAWIKSIAISLLLIFFVGGAAILLGRNKQKPVDWVYVNAIHERQNVKLPDGSRLLLRKGSSVAYPTDFGEHDRNLKLKGEAYFELLNHASSPLSVNSLKGITTEKGTSFFIRSNDTLDLVIVSNGRVKLEGTQKGEFLVLDSGQKAELVGNRISKKEADREPDLAWTKEQLIFDRASLKQVAQDLNQFYGVSVQIDPEVPAQHIFITAHFENQSLSHILKEIAFKTGLSVSGEENAVQISMKQNPGSSPEKQPEEVKEEQDTKVTNEEKKKKKKWWRFWGSKG